MGKEMTEEELREKLEECIADCYRLPFQEIVSKILTLIREAGWKSPKEYRQALWDRNLSNRDKMMGWDK